MHAYIYIYTCIYIHTYIRTYIHTYIHPCTYCFTDLLYLYACIYIYIYEYIKKGQDPTTCSQESSDTFRANRPRCENLAPAHPRQNRLQAKAPRETVIQTQPWPSADPAQLRWCFCPIVSFLSSSIAHSIIHFTGIPEKNSSSLRKVSEACDGWACRRLVHPEQ